jgi:Flp pilus assembly protein TadG
MIRPREFFRLARLGADRSGTVVVEFALVLPVLLILILGSYEAANLLIAYLKLEAAAETAADLVSQTPQNTYLQSSGSSNGWDFANISNAVDQVMTPLPTSSLKIAYASVTFTGTNGAAVIDWHKEVNSATAITIATLPSSVSAGTLGNATQGSTDSFVVVQLTYPYASPISYILNSTWNLTEAAFNRPRYVNCVPTTMNTNSVCP